MSCKNICKLCDHLVISTAVNFDGTANQVVIGIPAGTYNAGEKYCIVVAQNIPASVTVNSTVTVSIGTTATRYPVNNCDCTPLTGCGIKSRTKYSTRLAISPAGAVFKMLGKACNCEGNTAGSISG